MSDEQPIKKSLSVSIINNEFTWYAIARFLFITGLRMSPVLLGWRLYELTGSKLSIGILGLSEVIPAIALALPAGVKVDRSNKHKLISICIALYFFLILGLLLVTSAWIEMQGSKKNHRMEYLCACFRYWRSKSIQRACI